MGDVFWERMLGADRGDAAFGGFAGFGESIITGVEIFAFLEWKVRRSCDERGEYFKGRKFTLSLFWRRSFLLGSFPYRRNSFCSSSLRDLRIR